MHRIDDALLEDLNAAVVAGLVSVKSHPSLPLRIFNYTKQCAYRREWTPVTLMARGLILNDRNEIVARPLPKFFNMGEHTPEELKAMGPVDAVYEKMDGSLGIAYMGPNGPAIATRGSFTSDQALHATKLLEDVYPFWRMPEDATVLFEIIYPDNRIVTDYGNLNDLVLLAVINNRTGGDMSLEYSNWYGPRARQFKEVPSYSRLEDALAIVDRVTADEPGDFEGVILKFMFGRGRVKCKRAEYVRLHRLMTGITARRVWEELAAGRPIDWLIEGVPEEFESWIETTAYGLRLACTREINTAQGYLEMVRRSGYERTGNDRKDFAMAVQKYVTPKYRGPVFSLHDGRDIYPWAWKQVRPEHDTPFAEQSEDAN